MAKRINLKTAVDIIAPLIEDDNVVDRVNRACAMLYAQAPSAVERVRLIRGFYPPVTPPIDEGGYEVVVPPNRSLVVINEDAIDSVLKFIDDFEVPYDIISANDMYDDAGYDASAFVDYGVYEGNGRVFLVPSALATRVDEETGMYLFSARVRPAFVDAVVADDLLPFTNVEPIKNMVLAMKMAEQGDVQSSTAYFNRSINFIEAEAGRNKAGRKRNVKIARKVTGLRNTV